MYRCPFKWLCPISSPVTDLNWFLFNYNRPLVLLIKGTEIKSFTCFSPIMDFNVLGASYSSSPSKSPLTALPGNMQAGSSLMNEVSTPSFAKNWQFHCLLFPHILAPITGGPCYVLPVSLGIAGSSRLILR